MEDAHGNFLAPCQLVQPPPCHDPPPAMSYSFTNILTTRGLTMRCGWPTTTLSGQSPFFLSVRITPWPLSRLGNQSPAVRHVELQPRIEGTQSVFGPTPKQFPFVLCWMDRRGRNPPLIRTVLVKQRQQSGIIDQWAAVLASLLHPPRAPPETPNRTPRRRVCILCIDASNGPAGGIHSAEASQEGGAQQVETSFRSPPQHTHTPHTGTEDPEVGRAAAALSQVSKIHRAGQDLGDGAEGH